MGKYKIIRLTTTLLILSLEIIILSILLLTIRSLMEESSKYLNIINNNISYVAEATKKYLSIEVNALETESIKIVNGYKLANLDKLAKFIKIQDENILIEPGKYDIGEYEILLEKNNNKISYKLIVKAKEINKEALLDEVLHYLGEDSEKYGIYLYDLLAEDTVLSHQADKIVEPASIAKLPVAVLILRDVDSKKITLDTTYPMWNAEKFSTQPPLGSLPNGTPVTMRSYLENLIKFSDNNAWYALVNYLGDSYEGVNPRVIKELGINPLFLDPALGKAKTVAKLLIDVYKNKTLTKESADYLINLMENATPWAREGIGLGLPSGIRYANKIGTLNASGKVSYQDGAIVWGEKTDYVLVIMDENVDWATGKEKIKNLSKIIFKTMN